MSDDREPLGIINEESEDSFDAYYSEINFADGDICGFFPLSIS